MRRRDLLIMCLQNLLRHRGRTMLTVLGVVVGCCAVIIMISIGIGMKESQEKMLSEMGDLTIITVMPGGKSAKLTDKSVRAFQQIKNVEAASPKLTASGLSITVYAGTNHRFRSDSPELVGLYPETIEALGYRLTEGEPLSKKPFTALAGQYFAYSFTDTKRPNGRNTVFFWPDENGHVADPYLDPLKTPLELEIETTGESGKKLVQKLTITGRMKEDYGKGYETSMGILMDIRDLSRLIDEQRRAAGKAALKKKEYETALVKVQDIRDVAAVEQSIRDMGFRTSSMESIRKPMEKEARQKQMMLGGLGAISLFVAALGIANTMMMSITERTREIGIMKSLGCYVHDVRAVFLLEAGCIGLLGGAIGVVISEIISAAMNFAAAKGAGGAEEIEVGMAMSIGGGTAGAQTSVIPLWLILFALLFSILIGVASGYYPANKAVQIPALEAIKHD